jgi:carbon storage regulator
MHFLTGCYADRPVPAPFTSHLACKLLLPSRTRKAEIAFFVPEQIQENAQKLTEERIMLVLSRKLGQSFHIGPEVRVTIVKIDRNSVRIGIEAPFDVSVQREEIAFDVPEPRVLKVDAA